MPVNHNSKDPFGILEGYAPADMTADMAEEDELDLVSLCTQRWEESRESRQARQRTWDYNRLLLKGETFVALTRSSSEVLRVVVEGDPRGPRSVDNMLRPFHRAFVGKLIRSIPAVVSRPRTNDREDMLTAEIESSWLDYMWHAEELALKYKRAVEYIPPMGTGVLQVTWDRDHGDEVAFCPTGCGYMDYNAQPGEPCPACAGQATMAMEAGGQPEEVATLEAAAEGGLRVLNIPTHDFYPDRGATELHECQFIDISRVLPVSEVRRRFPDRAHLITSEADLYRDRYIYSTGKLTDSRVETVDLQDHVRMHEFHEAPTGEYPDGRIIFMANSRIMGIYPNVYYRLLKRFPVYLFRGDRTEGDLWGDEILTQAEPQQRERDILLTQKRRHRELTINPRVLTSWNSGINAKSMTSTPGEILKLKSQGAFLRYMDVPTLPNYIMQDQEQLKQSCREKFGVTPHELGGGDAGQSGRYAAFLEAQSSETIRPLNIEINTEWRGLNEALVVLARQFISPEKIWTTTGTDRVMTRSWAEAKGRKGNVYLAEEDALSKNPTLKLQGAMQLLQAGNYMDENTGRPDLKAFRRDAGLRLAGTTGDVDSAEHTYFAQVPDIIEEALMSGNMAALPQPAPWDDARIASEELMAWLRAAGRSKPEPVQRKVAELWMLYAMSMAPPGMQVPPDVAKLMPNSGLMGQWQQQGAQQQGGSPGMGSGAMPASTAPPTAEQDAAQLIQGADKMAQGVARGGQPQES